MLEGITGSYGEILLSVLKDEMVEVYFSSSAKSREFADFTVDQKEVIRGIFREAVGDVMVIEVVRNGGSNMVFINCWTVTAVLKPQNGISIIDVYCEATDKQVK